MIADYLGWDYAFIVAYGLGILWASIIGFYLRKNKNNKRKQVAKKWWFWLITSVLVFHVFFVLFLNTSYFGYGTPDYFTQIKITENEVILIDNDVTYYDDDISGTEDMTSHLRIHVVDRTTHLKKYSKLIGDNYSSLIDDNGIFMVENSMCANYDQDNIVYSVSEFDVQSQKLIPIVTNDGTITVGGEEIKVFEIKALFRIEVKSDQGDVYCYNSLNKTFEPIETFNVNNAYKPVQFFMNTSASSDKTTLMIDNKSVEREFLLGKIVASETRDSSAYVLVKSYTDLHKTEAKYSLLNKDGEFMWSTDLQFFEKLTGIDDLEDIQLFAFEADKCFLTIDAYLFVMELETGRLNWWLKL